MDGCSYSKKIYQTYENKWNIDTICYVEYICEYKLLINFRNGISKTIDFEPYILKNTIFKKFLKIENFKKFRIDHGVRLYWNGNKMDFHYLYLLNNI